MTVVDSQLRETLKSLLQGRVSIVGIGNRQRSDDGVGPRLIDSRLPGCPGTWWDAGVAPENFLEPIARSLPDTVLIVDAVAFDGSPGECRLVDLSLHAVSVSTHAGSISILADYLTARIAARTWVLGIQPASIRFGEGLSPCLEETVRELAALLNDVLGQTGQSCTTSL